MDLEQDDRLVSARIMAAGEQVILATERGQSIKFAISELRTASRTSGGVRGIRLAAGDAVIGIGVASPDAHMFVITSNGFGKRTLIKNYPQQRRGGGGVRTFKIVEKSGKVVSARVVHPGEELLLISARGIVIRTSSEGIPVQGRDTQGVSVMRVDPGDRVVSIGALAKD